MSRTTALLSGLAVVLVLATWYALLWSPRVDDLAALETQIADVQATQGTSRVQIAELQLVREQAPQLQAELEAAESLLPRDAALPSALRQFQLAADESGATLVSVAPARPEPVEGASPELSVLSLALELEGSYFQIVDTLRRLEDPAISPRGFVWESVALTVEEHPTLTVSVTGRMFAILPAPPAPDAGTAPEDPGAVEEDTDGEPAETPEDDAPPDEAPADAPTDVPEGEESP